MFNLSEPARRCAAAAARSSAPRRRALENGPVNYLLDSIMVSVFVRPARVTALSYVMAEIVEKRH